jgi:hypothetical protein
MSTYTLAEALKNSPFPTGSTASAVVKDLDDLFDARMPRLAKIRDMYDRKPPYDPGKLTEAGQGYRANINTGEMEALIDDETSQATEAIMSALPIANFSAPGQVEVVRTKLAYAYHEFLHEAESFNLHHFVDKVHFETNAYAYATATFASGKDWRPKWQPHFETRFDETAVPDVDENDTFAVHTRTSISSLFEELDFDPDAVAEDWYKGWNVPELRKFLVDHTIGLAGDDHKTYTNRYLEAAQAYRDGYGWASSVTRFKKIKLVHLYAKHPKTGKVCHMILSGEPPKDDKRDEYSSTPDSLPELSPDAGVLFYKEAEFEKMSNCAWVMTYNLGPSTLLSVRGLAHRAFLHTDLSNRYYSQIVDSGFLASSLLLQTPEADSHARVPLVRAGAVSVLPSGFTPAQGSFQPNFGHLLSLRDASSAIMHNNLGTYRRRPESSQEKSRDKSATEAQNEASRESEAEQNRASYRMRAWSGLHKEIFRRVSDKSLLGGLTVEKFVDLAVEKALDLEEVMKELGGVDTPWRRDVISFYISLLRNNVPLSVVFDVRWKVSASRGMGAGSRQARLGAIQDLMGIVAWVPREKQDRIRHAYVAERTANMDLADDLFPLDVPGSNSREMAMAVLEQNQMKDGRSVAVPVDVDHVIHFDTHMGLLYEEVKKWQEDASEELTQELNATMIALVPHLGAHLEYISRDPITAGQTQQYVQELQRMQEMAQAIMRAAQYMVKRTQEDRDALAQEIAQLRAMADKTGQEMQIKAQEVQGRLAIEQAKTESLNQNRIMKTGAQLQTRQFSWEQDEMRKMQTHQLEMQRQLDKLMAEREALQLQNEKLRSQISTGGSIL